MLQEVSWDFKTCNAVARIEVVTRCSAGIGRIPTALVEESAQHWVTS